MIVHPFTSNHTAQLITLILPYSVTDRSQTALILLPDTVMKCNLSSREHAGEN